MSKVNKLNKKFIYLSIFVWNGKEYLIKRFLMLVLIKNMYVVMLIKGEMVR